MIARTILITLLGIQALNAHTLTPRIKFGIKAARQQFRSVVRVLWGSRLTKDIEYGAGVAINPHWVLTGSQIIKSFPCCGTVKVQAGKYEQSTPKHDIQTVKIETVLPHEDYNRHSLENDIGLLGTNETIRRGEFIDMARLPSQDFVHVGEVNLVGWGNTIVGIGASASKYLQNARVPTISNEECQDHLNRAKITKKLLDSQMCTFDPNLNPVPLKGDGGGPLIIHENNIEKVVGIISWIFKTESKTELPSVHTKVSFFKTWITNKISQYPIITK